MMSIHWATYSHGDPGKFIMAVCLICRDDSFDYTTSCGHHFHVDCFRLWYSNNKCCPYCMKMIDNFEISKPLPKPCDVCKVEPSDFVTRCGHYIHKGTCSGLGNRRYGRCPVCNTRISRSQKKEMISSKFKWENEDLELSCPLSLMEVAILACESTKFLKKASLEFVINRLQELDEDFNMYNIVYKRSQLNLSGIACRSNNFEAIKALVLIGYSLNPLFEGWNSPVLFAIKTNNLELLNFLIDNGADPLKYLTAPVKSLYSLNQDKPVVFERLIELGFDPLKRLKYNQTLLILAVEENLYTAVVRLIEDYKLDVNAKSDRGFTALLKATSDYIDPRIIEVLIKNGANFTAKTSHGADAFQLACRNSSFKLVKIFYELLKPNIDAYDPEGHTPLIWACCCGDMNFVNYLVEKGADIDKPSKLGVGPISFACIYGHFEIVKRLIDLGASLNELPPRAMKLPIQELVLNCSELLTIERIEKLVELGADVNACDKTTNTVLHTAAYNQFNDLIEVLVTRYGADVNAENRNGDLPIHFAITENTVALLLSLGSKPKHVHNKGNHDSEPTKLTNDSNLISEPQESKCEPKSKWRLFGVGGSKKKSAEGPKESILQMRSTLEMLEKKEKHLDAKIQQETEFARSHASSNKNQALMALKRRKQYEIQQENIRGARFNLETQIMTIENAHINLETLQAMRAGSSAMKSIHGELDVDKVDDVMEEVREQMDLANEISQSISNPLGMDTGIDEDELEAELERFEQEALDAALLDTNKPVLTPVMASSSANLNAPTASAASMTKSSSQPLANDEDAELEELRASMAL